MEGLLFEVQQLQSLVESKSKIIVQLEASIANAATAPMDERSRSMILAYKKEKEALQATYSNLVERYKTVSSDLEVEKDHSGVLERQIATMLADALADREEMSRLRAELSSKQEELLTKCGEIDFVKTKLASRDGIHKAKMKELEAALETEVLLRREKENEVEMYSEALISAKTAQEEMIEEHEKSLAAVEGKLAEMTSEYAAVEHKRDSLFDALQNKITELEALKIQGESSRVAIALEAFEQKELLEEALVDMKRKLEAVEVRRAAQFADLRSAAETAEAAKNEALAQLEKAREEASFLKQELVSQQTVLEEEKHSMEVLSTRLNAMLLKDDATDETWVAVEEALRVINVNMCDLEAKLRIHTSSQEEQVRDVNEVAEEGHEGKEELSPRRIQRLLQRQEALFANVATIVAQAASSSSNSSSSSSPSPPPSPSPPASSGGEYHSVTEEIEAMTGALVASKLALAMAAAENEQLQMDYKNQEKLVCAQKLLIAELQARLG